MKELLLLLTAGNAVSSTLRDCSHLPRRGRYKKYSQGDQDGILQNIFKTIGTVNLAAVEFGFGYEANSGHSGEQLIEQNSGLNTRFLREKGWNVTYFDALISDSVAGIKAVTLTEDNIVSSFRAAGVPTEVDYVSIDVDSIDVWLLKALLTEYRPRVISIEYNKNFLSWMHLTHTRKWHAWTQRSVYGASAGAIDYVARVNGYRVVNIMPSGLDMFLVRKDVLDAHCNPRSIASFEKLAGAARLGERFHDSCSETDDLPRLVDLHLETEGRHHDAKLKARGEVVHLNSLHPDNPMCTLSSY
mmetsp:Transcript_42058/g.110752  ORF Transcript_42058/g.110752 Transcript_42058/m.110752 type:complete len:301 (-) Transcript_42058:221-1123(-)|eukprot:CAMPEP_0115846014 /NCGR_PEP_ID=MMETSP0287-20121206/9647_1 /TAXON_ID=412157 /ORGANISM="Chrysochromulina rotalis, Strain UIO044" /LENGTH=300 /DNA_ID=CAMNT_0003299801 /DNA_START=319 /DNA_END=1221 /DNA_ORIENTATION=+